MGLHLQRPLNLLYYGGNVEIMHTRLSSLADNIVFDHDRSIAPGLSVPLIRNIFETGAGPLKKMVETLSFKPSKSNALRSDIDISISHYFEDNCLRMDHLMTKAQKIQTTVPTRFRLGSTAVLEALFEWFDGKTSSTLETFLTRSASQTKKAATASSRHLQA